MNRLGTIATAIVAVSGLTAVLASAQMAPPARAHSSMIFDPARGRIVLVGGGTKTADDRWITLGDIWSWDGTRWETSSLSGAARSGHKLTYHTASSTLLVVGGNDNANSNLALLALDRDRVRTLAGDFPPRSEAAVAYDPVRKRVVVFGGIFNRASLGATHEFDGTEWHAINTTGPAPRNSAIMAFHPPTGRIVLSGGAGDNGKIFSDTWTWDGARWTLVDTVGPGPLMGAAAATDEERGEILIFGGVGPNGLSGETWAWNGARWEARRVTGPTPRVVATMAYDPVRRVVVLFGGRMEGLRDSDETWEWDGQRWTARNTIHRSDP